MSAPAKFPVPFDIVVIIIKLALATRVSIPPSILDRQLRTSVLLLSHDIRGTFLKEIYNTVILWSANAINKFADALRSSPSLGDLVLNLWVGSQELRGTSPVHSEGGVEIDPFHSLGRITWATYNLQRLYVAIEHDIPNGLHVLIPRSVQHLVLPKSWLRIATSQLVVAQYLPPNLQSFRFRGGQDADDLAVIANGPSQIQITLELRSLESHTSLGMLVTWALNARERNPGQFPIKVVVPPEGVAIEECEEYLILLEMLVRGGHAHGLAWFNVIGQELDDKTQLGIWLSEGERSVTGS
ncbi:hypothetical protein FRC07_005651 [Ceratobasidium sp. 392]|nr:hypothetical protein FRC07_005651 [Ceratobasidium sp. 392]